MHYEWLSACTQLRGESVGVDCGILIYLRLRRCNFDSACESLACVHTCGAIGAQRCAPNINNYKDDCTHTNYSNFYNSVVSIMRIFTGRRYIHFNYCMRVRWFSIDGCAHTSHPIYHARAIRAQHSYIPFSSTHTRWLFGRFGHCGTHAHTNQSESEYACKKGARISSAHASMACISIARQAGRDKSIIHELRVDLARTVSWNPESYA